MRVLVIEEQTSLARNLRHCLEEEGFVVDLAATAAEGNFKARCGSYDAILLDLLLSGADGLALLKGWRHKGVASPVLVLTVGGDCAETVRSLDLGADDALARPFQLAELLARLRALVRRGHEVRDPVIRIHDLELDTAGRAVKRAGQPIRLTPREFALLQFLAFHRGRVVTRPMIWEHLYDDQGENTSNVVDVYIRYLRNKIDKGFDPPLILTRWGEGYLLRGESA
jgi:DNA-binding response OmpR family regulator